MVNIVKVSLILKSIILYLVGADIRSRGELGINWVLKRVRLVFYAQTNLTYSIARRPISSYSFTVKVMNKKLPELGTLSLGIVSS